MREVHIVTEPVPGKTKWTRKFALVRLRTDSLLRSVELEVGDGEPAKARNMLKDFGSLLGRAWERFREEAGRRDPEDQIAELLGGMRREMVDARALVAELKDAVAGTRKDLLREQQSVVDCERRGEMAARIDDAETVRVAEEFAVRHREAVTVLQAKLQATEGELALRTREADQMAGRYREAEQQRFGMLAELRRAGARNRDTMQSLDDEFDRVAEQIDDAAARQDATRELESKLADLKRRAGAEPR